MKIIHRVNGNPNSLCNERHQEYSMLVRCDNGCPYYVHEDFFLYELCFWFPYQRMLLWMRGNTSGTIKATHKEEVSSLNNWGLALFPWRDTWNVVMNACHSILMPWGFVFNSTHQLSTWFFFSFWLWLFYIFKFLVRNLAKALRIGVVSLLLSVCIREFEGWHPWSFIHWNG